jgi:tetratricopeptide (TPR) repeat protein
MVTEMQGGSKHMSASQPEGRDVPDPTRHHTHLDLANETSEARKMTEKKPRGMMTVWAMLLLPVTLGGAGVTAWKMRAEDPAHATLQQVQEERDQARKAEAEIKKQLDQVLATRLMVEGERDQAVAAEKETRRSADDTRAVLDFLRDNVFLAPGRPTSWSREGLGKDVTLRKAVDLAASKVAGAFPDRPMAEATIREILGASYQDLGDAKQSVKQYERAFELRQAELGPDNPATCDCRNKLAVAYRDAGRTDEASRLYDLYANDKAQEAMRKRNPVGGQDSAPQGKRVPGSASRPAGQKG